MAMSVSSIRFEKNEREWIKAFADISGKSFSAQVREWTLEKLEDEIDSRDLREAIAKEDKRDKGIGIDDFMVKYGIS